MFGSALIDVIIISRSTSVVLLWQSGNNNYHDRHEGNSSSDLTSAHVLKEERQKGEYISKKSPHKYSHSYVDFFI